MAMALPLPPGAQARLTPTPMGLGATYLGRTGRFTCTHLAFWAQLRDGDGSIKFKPLNHTHVPQLLRGRWSLPFEEVAAGSNSQNVERPG